MTKTAYYSAMILGTVMGNIVGQLIFKALSL